MVLKLHFLGYSKVFSFVLPVIERHLIQGSLRFLFHWFECDGISDQTLVVPGVQHSFSGVVVHHGVVAVLIGELNIGVPCTARFEVVSKVDGCGLGIVGVYMVDHTTGDKSIPKVVHSFCV